MLHGFCNLSKEFDSVWHKGLLLKLHTYGITGNLFKWVNIYLVSTKQKVIYLEVLSSTKSVNAGVPQGSVFGSLLFLIHENDIADNMLKFCRLFADDYNSFHHAAIKVQDMEFILNLDHLNLEIWSKIAFGLQFFKNQSS